MFSIDACRRAVAATLLLAGPAAAAAPAEPAPAAAGAFANAYVTQFREETLGDFESARWRDFVLEVLFDREGARGALAVYDELQTDCSSAYIRAHPLELATAKEFLDGEEGQAWLADCIFERGLEAPFLERFARGQVALSEIALAASLLTRETGLADALALSEEAPAAAMAGLEDWVRGRLLDWAAFAHCGTEKGVAAVGPTEAAQLSDRFSEAMVAALAGCSVPEPRPLPAAVAAEPSLPFDAWGQPVVFLGGIEEILPNGGRWGATALAVTAAAIPERWRQARRSVELEALCSREYLAKNPAATAEDYELFKVSDAAGEFLRDCGNRLLADPDRGAARRESLAAALEIGLDLAQSTDDLPELAGELALADAEEVPPALFARALRRAALWAPLYACQARALFGSLGADFVSVAFSPAPVMDPALVAKMKAALAKADCMPDDGSFSAGEVVDVESELLRTFAKKFASADWARLVLAPVLGDDPELLALLAAEAHLQARCGRLHRQAYQELALADYGALLHTQNGRQPFFDCQVRAAEDPQAGAGLREAILAGLATRYTVVSLFQFARTRIEVDYGSVTPEPTAEERRLLAAEAARLKEEIGCAVTRVARERPLGEILAGEAKVALEAARKSARCRPDPARPAGEAGG